MAKVTGQFFLGRDGRFHDLSNLGEVCVLEFSDSQVVWSEQGDAYDNMEALGYVPCLDCTLYEGMRPYWEAWTRTRAGGSATPAA